MKCIHMAVLLVLIAAATIHPASSTAPDQADAGITFSLNASNDLVDAMPGDGICETAAGNDMCTLRAAIMEANAHIGDDIILLPAATYLLTITGVGEDASATGDLDVTESLTLIGESADTTIIDASSLSDRVLQVSNNVETVEISHLTLTHGQTSGEGGGIFTSASLELHNVQVYSNNAGSVGGGIFGNAPLSINRSYIASNSAQTGGGIYANKHLTIINSIIEGNHTDTSGGGLFLLGLGTPVSINDTIFNANTAQDYGSAIYNFGDEVDLDQSVMSNNIGGYAGAIYNAGDGTFLLNDSTVISNTSNKYGGGLYNAAGFMSLLAVTVTANHTEIGGGITNMDSMEVTNSTISGNTASSNGGGIYNSGTTSVNNSTIVNNMASSGGFSGDGGGVYADPASTFTFKNTILFNNHHRRLLSIIDDDCYGTLTTAHYNLVGVLDNCTLTGSSGLDLIGVDPLLGPLADNHGPTFTHALQSGSPAIDSANPQGCFEGQVQLKFDQRGLLRHWDGNGDGTVRCDIGSFEYGSKMLIFLPITRK